MRFSRDIFVGVTMAMSSLAAFTATAFMWQLAGMDFAASFTISVLLSLAGTLWLAHGGYELVLTPSLTVTGYLVFIVAISHGLGWQTVLGSCFLASVLGIVLCHFAGPVLRKGWPPVLSWGIQLALAVFIISLGLKLGRIIITSPWQVTMLGDAADPLMFWSMAGVVLTVALLAAGWRCALFAGMTVTGLVTFGEGFWVIPAAPFFLPAGLDKVAGQLNFATASSQETAFFVITVLSLTVMLSVIHGSTSRAFCREKEISAGVKKLFILGALGALCGSSPLVASPASAAKAEAEDSRRAVLAAGVVLALALFCEPIIAAFADFPAMVVPVLAGSGFLLLLETVKTCPLAQTEAETSQRAEVLAVTVMVLLLSLTGNFATALGSAVIGYVLFMTMAGKARQVTKIIWLISGIFALYYSYGSMF